MDTTDVLFPSQKANKQGFGLGSDGEHPGLFLHPVLGVDAANGGIIGLVNCIVLRVGFARRLTGARTRQPALCGLTGARTRQPALCGVRRRRHFLLRQ
jgi:hypothetical protein